MPTSTWASSSPTPACPASSLLGLKTSKHSPSSLRAASPSLVISNEAGRLFFPLRSCEAVGLRRETSAPPSVFCEEKSLFLFTSLCARHSPLHKQNAIIALRPVIHDFFHLQTRRAQLLDHHLLRDAMPSAVARNSFNGVQPRTRWKIDNRQPPSRLQRPRQVRVKLRRLGQVMVYAPQKNRVAARRRQIRVRLFALHNDDVCQLAPGNFLLQFRQLLCINLRRIHFSRRPHMFHCRKCVFSVPRSNVGRHCSRLPSHQLRQPLDFLRRVPAHLRRKYRSRRARQPHQQ